MTRLYLWGLLAVLSFSTFAQTANSNVLRCEIQGCPEPPSLFEFNGITFSPVQQGEKVEGAVYEFRMAPSSPRFYYLGNNPNNMIPLILGAEPMVVVKGTCGAIRAATVEQSKINQDYNSLKEKMNEQRNQAGQLIRQYQVSFGEKREEVVAEMKVLDDQKLALLDSLRKADPFLGKIVALNTYLSFQNYPKGYSDEIEYFAKEYFSYVDFKDPDYRNLPWIYEAFRNYTTTIVSVRLSEEKQKEYLTGTLAAIPQGSATHKLALAGVMNILQQKNNGNYLYFANQFVETFKDSDPAAVANLQMEVKKAQSFMIGGEAPDFTLKTPEGQDMSLSELRGKVVLIDFWASWCGPCRRENPNVVRMYNEYKDKGFDILGVSLDKTQDRWVEAIQQDGLSWHHVSDLKGWANEVAQAYGVRSIPHTVLIDAEGKILARNLRGEALEQKLAELFD